MRLNSTDHIIQAANSLVRKFGTRDPEKIARELGIQIYNVPMKKQKGMYKVIKRNRCIFINDNLDEVMRTIVLLHEIGHDQLHRRQAVCFQEFQLFDMSKNTMEYEANLFASQIALPDEEVIDYIYQGFSIDQIAGEMNSDINLVGIARSLVYSVIASGSDSRLVIGRIDDGICIHFCDVITDDLKWHRSVPFLRFSNVIAIYTLRK